MSIIFALITFIGWGVGDLFAAIATRASSAKYAYFWAMTFAFMISALYIPYAGPITNWGMFFLACLFNIIHGLANLSALKGFEVGKTSIVGTLAGTSTVITVLISLFLFNETLRGIQIFGIVLITLGGIMLAFKFGKNAFKRENIFSDPGIIYGLGAMLGWGIYFAIVRIPAEEIGWFWAGFPLYPMALLMPFFMTSLKRDLTKIFSMKKLFMVVILYMLFMTIADYTYNLAILAGFTSVVSPISDAYPVLFVILTRYVFKEHLSGQQKSGIIISLAGIVVMGISSV